MGDKELDKHIASQLSSHTADEVADWAKMSEMIAHDGLTTADLDFDETIREKVKADRDERVQNPTDWDAFSTSLTAHEAMSDQEFDQDIKAKLSESEATSSSSHWVALKASLESELALKRSIIIHKSLEIATIALLLLMLYDGLLVHMTGAHDRMDDSQIVADIPSSLPSGALDFSLTANTKPDAAQGKQEKDINGTVNDPNPTVNYSRNDQVVTIDETDALEFKTPQTLVQETHEQTKQNTNKSKPSLSNERAVDDHRLLVALPLIETIKNTVNTESKSEVSPLLYLKSNDKARLRRSIAVAASGDFNVANRPLDINVFQEPKTYGALGASLSADIQWEHRSLAYELGIAYSQKSFDPNQLERLSILSSKYERDFERQEFNIVQLPFTLKRYWNNERTARFYAGVGTTLNFIASTSYTVQDLLRQGAPRSPQLIRERSSFSNKDFHDGFAEGGTFAENSFITAVASLGVERKVGNVHLIAETRYAHHLFAQKLGPNNEKLNAISLILGARVFL